MRQKRPDRVLGAGHDEFWAWCDKLELRLQQCDACNKLLWPVMKNCDRCGSAHFRWQKLSGRGRVVSWGTFVQDFYRGVMSVPYDAILVELEEGPLFISNSEGFGESDIEFGMAVTVRFKQCEDSSGPFNLPVFGSA